MALHRCVFHVGPVGVKQVAHHMKAAGLKRVTAGTERVFADVRAANEGAALSAIEEALARKVGSKKYNFLRGTCWRRPKSG